MILKLFKKNKTEIKVENLDEFYDNSITEAEAANEKLTKEYGLGTFERWDFDQETGEIAFKNEGQIKIIAKVSFIGSFSKNSNSWMWGWGNESLLSPLTDKIKIVKEFGEKNNIEDFVDRVWAANDEAGWAMSSAALKIIGGLGIYRGPTEKTDNYFLIHEIFKVENS